MNKDALKRRKPPTILVSGQIFKATVLEVTGFDEDGSPREFRILRDHESTQVEDGKQFWIVYASSRVIDRKDWN